MRRDAQLDIITQALQQLIPAAAPAFLSVEVTETLPGTGERRNTWTGTIDGLAERVFTALYGRPSATPDTRSPLEQAADAKRARDLAGELGALTGAERDLVSAPWYPVRHGDLVHVHYESVGELPAFGETYAIEEIPGDELVRMRLLHHTADSKDNVGVFVAEAIDDPIYELWFEAGPHRLTIVRDGQVVHDGGRRRGGTAAARVLLAAEGHAATMREVQRYLERGEPELALARLKSDKPLPACGAPGFTPEQADCARPRGHHGACCDNRDYTEPPHECPALPEQLHAVVTVGAKVEGVHFAGLYADRDAAADHAMGFHAYRGELERLTERFVKPAPGLAGEMLLELPKENELSAFGVQLAVVVPLPVLPDPRAEEELAAEGMAAALGPEDYADDFRDVDE